MRLIDAPLARRVRGVGLALLATVLVLLWAFPAASRGIRPAMIAVLAGIVVVVAFRLVRILYLTRNVPGFFGWEYRWDATASLIALVVAGALLALLALVPAASVALRVVQSAALVLCALASPIWTVPVTLWIWDRQRAGRRRKEKGDDRPVGALTDRLREHTIVEMRDQDGSRMAFPDVRHAMDWLDVMRPGDSVTFLCIDGGRLQIDGPASDGGFSVRCLGGDGSALADVPALQLGRVRAIVVRYLEGGAPGSVTLMTGDVAHPEPR